MIKKKLLNSFIIGIVCLCACDKNSDIKDELDSKFRQFESNWTNCFELNFKFPVDTLIVNDEFLECTLSEKRVFINDNRYGYKADVLYQSGFSTYNPDVYFQNNSLENKIHMGFIDFSTYRYITLSIPYKKDSLNHTIQKILSNSVIECSTNFLPAQVQFETSTTCPASFSVTFSTFFSTKENQNINIDNFYYELYNGKWHYHLEFSQDELWLGNDSWNVRSMTDYFGHQRTSDLLIEEIRIEDLKCILDFELTEE